MVKFTFLIGKYFLSLWWCVISASLIMSFLIKLHPVASAL